MCDFEESLCDFEIEDEVGTWVWMYPKQDNVSFPYANQDHTYNTGYGHYLAAPLTNDRDGIVGRVVTPEFQMERHEPQCLSFWYIHNGQMLFDTLTVFLRQGTVVYPAALWRENANHGYSWLWANIPIPSGNSKFNVIWEAKQRRWNSMGVMILDDIELHMSECPKIGTCNFQYGTCGWQNLYPSVNGTQDIVWLQAKGSDGLVNDAPAADHSGDTEGSIVDLKGDAGELSINTVVASGSESNHWYETLPTYGAWVQGQVRIEAKNFIGQNIAYQLHVIGIRHSQASIIALDDFQFEHRISCPRMPALLTTTPTPTPLVWSCDFSVDFCGMVPVEGFTASWVRNDTLEQIDGTQDPYYITISGKGTASIITTRFEASPLSPLCLTFYYIIDGANAGALSILPRQGQNTKEGFPMTDSDEILSEHRCPFSVVFPYQGDYLGEALWTQGRPQGDQWLTAHANINFEEPVEIVIEGEVGSNQNGIIALDEIKIHQASCSIIKPTDTPGEKCHYLAAPLENGRNGIVGRIVTPEFEKERHESQCLKF
ncbi:hypothetical protein SK128_025159, partial [Halocaridina rubra]